MRVPGDLIAVARILGPYGVKGWLKIEPYSPVPAPQKHQLLAVDSWWIAPAEVRSDHPPKNPCETPQALHIKQAKPHGQIILASAQELCTPEQVKDLKGWEVFIPRSAFAKLAEDEFYWVDLIGCDVINRSKQYVGKVIGMDDHGAHPILFIETLQKLEVLIPFVAAYVDEVRISEKTIVVDWSLDEEEAE